jgi:hypothetical protein
MVPVMAKYAGPGPLEQGFADTPRHRDNSDRTHVDAGKEGTMPDAREAVLFEQGTVRVTTERFIVGSEGSYPVGDWVSAKASQHRPVAANWLLGVVILGLGMALVDGVFVLLGAPGANLEDNPQSPSLIYSPAWVGWMFLLAGLAVAAVGAMLAVLVGAIWSRHEVLVYTKWGVQMVVFKSRDREQVEATLKAIRKAIRSRKRISPGSSRRGRSRATR